MKKRPIVLTIFFVLTLSACVKSYTVAERQLGDEALDCNELATRMGELDAIKELALKEKGFSGKNVAAGIFFPAAVIGNEMNANETIQAMDKRKSTLTERYQSKNCDAVIPQYSIEEIKEKIKNDDVKELQG